MGFLRSVADYRRTATKRNTDTRQNLKIFKVSEDRTEAEHKDRE
jgi:hypothetical protein